MSRSTAHSNSQILVDLKDFTCPISLSLFFNPAQAAPCGHVFEFQEIQGYVGKNCPCCREGIVILCSPSPFFRNALHNVLTQNLYLYSDVYFDLSDFEKTFKEENGLKTPVGKRYITLMENADNYLNEAIGVLVSTLHGRDLLRKKLKIEEASGKYFFGNAEISAESLQAQVNGKSIREWLSMTTALDQFEINAIARMSAIEKEVEAIRSHKEKLFNQSRLFVSPGVRGLAGQNIPSDAVNLILQQVSYGNENAVKAVLEAVKSNPTQLSTLLSGTGTVKDYSYRVISGMTLLQAAAAAGDIEMCQMLKPYFDLIPNGQQEFANQLAEIFPEGIEAHEAEQQRNTFNFDTILAAIRAASTADLDSSLNKRDNGSALCRALEEFRRQFTEISHSEEIFNPQHLLRAFEVYNALWDQCERDGSDRDYKKRDLFWRQIIGYIQRFMPACYAQAFSQGLYYLVKVDQDDSWRPEALKRDLKLRCVDFSYFPLPVDSRSCLGFDFAIYAGAPWRDTPAPRWVGASVMSPATAFFKNFCGAKTSRFQNIMPRVRVQSREQSSNERRCVVQ